RAIRTSDRWEGTMALRETLQRILTSYPQATQAPLKDHPLAQFITGDAETTVSAALGELRRPLQPTRADMPPSTGSSTPVMKLASSEARNRAAWAVSQAVPILPRRGTRALRASRTASVDEPTAVAIPDTAMGVSISPGNTTLQRTPWAALALATLVVNRFIAALETS